MDKQIRLFVDRIQSNTGDVFYGYIKADLYQDIRWISTKNELFNFIEWSRDRNRYPYYFNSYRWLMSSLKNKFHIVKEVPRENDHNNRYKQFVAKFKQCQNS